MNRRVSTTVVRYYSDGALQGMYYVRENGECVFSEPLFGLTR